MVNPNDLTSFNSLTREEVLRELKPILGEEYCDWNASLLYTITKMANDITHFKIDNQVWYDKSQELENEVATHLQALNTAQEWHERQKRELTEQKDQVIREKQQLQNQLQDSQQRILALEADKQDLIQQLTQAQEIYQNYLNQEKSLIQQEIQLIKEAIHV